MTGAMSDHDLKDLMGQNELCHRHLSISQIITQKQFIRNYLKKVIRFMPKINCVTGNKTKRSPKDDKHDERQHLENTIGQNELCPFAPKYPSN